MAVDYPHRRVKVGFAADADPNASEPVPADLIRLRSRPGFGNTLTIAHALYLTFESATLVDVVGGSLTFTAWERDAATKKWVKVNSTAATLTGRLKLNGTGVQEADLFIQVLTVTPPGGATQLTIHATEQGTEGAPGYGGGPSLGTVTADQGKPNAGGADAWPVKLELERATGGVPVGVVVSNTAVLLAAANAARRSIAIVNNGPTDVYLGGDATVMASGATMGTVLRANGGSYTDAGEDLYTGDLYGIGGMVVASENVSVWERT